MRLQQVWIVSSSKVPERFMSIRLVLVPIPDGKVKPATDAKIDAKIDANKPPTEKILPKGKS